MKTLAYFASGPISENYHALDFGKIYLIDNCFKKKANRHNNYNFSEKNITCIGMDCLESIALLEKMKVKIDYFVSINEGLFEGGGSYAINSDMFLGYAMPLFKDNYIHIMSEKYYADIRRGGGGYHVTMDLPYIKEEIGEDDPRYIDPFIFSDSYGKKGDAKVFQMTKIEDNTVELNIAPQTKTRIIHDSIWNHYQKLDMLAIAILDQGQGDFFERIPKILNISSMNFNDILFHCEKHKIEKLGLTPWGQGDYGDFINRLQGLEGDFPKEISLFHLNKDDFSGLKQYARKM